MSSFLQQSGDQKPFSEIVPDSLRAGGLTKASSIVQRRTVRLPPQTGPTYGTPGTGAGAANAQVQFLVADQGGLVDPRSFRLNYTIRTSGTGVCPDDGHPFNTVQIQLNGNMIDNVTNAQKVSNIEFCMGASKSYYQTAGSLQGWELLSDDMNTVTPTATPTAAMLGKWGWVANNTADISARCQRSSNTLMNNSLAGSARSLPLGLLSGVFRCPTALPLSILGELNILLVTGSANENLFTQTTAQSADYSLANVSLEYDVLVPSADLMEMYKQVAMNPTDAGLNYVVETSILTGGATIAASASALVENNIVVSRASSYVTRSSVIQIPTTALSVNTYPSQSCFQNGNTYSVQWRVGSQVFPQIPPQGPAALFNMSLAAYGGPTNENGTVVNRLLWGNSTDITTPGTAAVYAGSECTTTKFAYSDRFIPSISFEQVRGGYTKPDLQGISLSGASGSQLIATLVSAPPVQYSVYMLIVALKIIRAQGGSPRVEGA